MLDVARFPDSRSSLSARTLTFGASTDLVVHFRTEFGKVDGNGARSKPFSKAWSKPAQIYLAQHTMPPIPRSPAVATSPGVGWIACSLSLSGPGGCDQIDRI